MNHREIVVEVGAEGGSITLYGSRKSRGWHFYRNLMDWTPALLDEPTLDHDSKVVKTWPAALKLLDQYPWHHLFPIRVHPEFQVLVLDAVMARYQRDGDSGPDRRSEWIRLCGGVES
jgi:hypothetical protein